MKTLALSALLLGMMVLGVGCAQTELGRNEFGATPAYSGRERLNLIAQSWDTDWKEAQDDIDDVLLLRPASQMTIWHVR